MIMEVGQPLFGRQQQYSEGTMFEYTPSGPLLIYSFERPTPKEISSFNSGDFEMAFYETPPVIWILSKIQGVSGWNDAPFSIRMYDGNGIQFDWSDEIGEGKGLGLTVVLIDALTGIIQAPMRFIGCDTRFSRELRKAILRQFQQPFSHEEYNYKVDEIMRNYTTDELVRRALHRFRVRR